VPEPPGGVGHAAEKNRHTRPGPEHPLENQIVPRQRPVKPFREGAKKLNSYVRVSEHTARVPLDGFKDEFHFPDDGPVAMIHLG
jgi:hypothetical protein